MKYFITETERNGTCYHEWYKGHFDGISFWEKESLLISDDILYQLNLERIFNMFIPDYDSAGECEVKKEQWELIMKKAVEMGGELFECLKEADIWVRNTFEKYDVFTMIGL